MSNMKKQLVILIMYAAAIAAATAQTDYTAKIKNPSFEENGLSGWTSQGYQSQTNTATEKQGWTKTGNVYAEKWSSNATSNGELYQVIEGLPDGYYVVTADAHAVLEGYSALINGVNLFADYAETQVRKGKTYTVKALSTNGKLKIGIRNEKTNANWIAIDNFHITAIDTTEQAYRIYLSTMYQKAKTLVNEIKAKKYFYSPDFQEAYKNASSSYKKSKEEVIDAANKLDACMEKYLQQRDSYKWLEIAITKSNNNLAMTDYTGKATVQEAIEKAKALLATDATQAQLSEMTDKLNQALDKYLKNRPSEWVTIQNGNLWKTNTGATVQAHAPGFVRVGDIWYMVGEDRSHSWNPDVNLYSSTDLVNWKFEKKIIENGVTSSELGSSRMIERAKLMYNEKTGKYVVWCHWEASNYGASEAACFASDEVNGTYEMVWSGRPLNIKSRDCNIFVDNDGTAYFISTTQENQHLGLFQLSDDYLSATNHTQLFSWQSREAPAIVRIGDRYFMFSSACSGWEPNQCKLSYTTNLKSGWSGLTNVGDNIAFDTQAAAILEIKGTKQTTYLYVGDRWQDPDLPNTKTIIFPISFNGTTCDFRYHERFDINFVTGEWRETPTEDVFADKKDWKVIDCSSEETSKENGRASNLLDGNINTKWHTQYSGTKAESPHYVTIDMGKEIAIKGFLATPRMDGSSNGLIRKYKFEVSNDGEKWTTVSSGDWLLYCTEVDFTKRNCRYIRLTCTEGEYASLSELDVVLAENNATDVAFVTKENRQISKQCYYTIDGKQIDNPRQGLFIERTFYTDGTTSSTKKYRK